tara:strand:- start:1019 stop:1264 length:246 start_codon:yes stop_codon:yes gene_type:complete
MEHIKLRLNSKPRKIDAEIGKIDISMVQGFWNGATSVIPASLRLLPNNLYTNHRCIDWYERVQIYHDKKMNQLKNFSWLKK